MTAAGWVAWVHACAGELRGCMRARVRWCARALVRACVRGCVGARMRAGVHTHAHSKKCFQNHSGAKKYATAVCRDRVLPATTPVALHCYHVMVARGDPRSPSDLWSSHSGSLPASTMGARGAPLRASQSELPTPNLQTACGHLYTTLSQVELELGLS